MTRKEAARLAHQQNALCSLGFTLSEAEALRRISMTLHRWHELECGIDGRCIERDGEDGDGRPFMTFEAYAGKRGRYAIPDREKGAHKRLAAILAERNQRAIAATPEPATIQGCVDNAIDQSVSAYVQGDPRGAALYIIRPGDVPEGARADSYYSRGICVY